MPLYPGGVGISVRSTVTLGLLPSFQNTQTSCGGGGGSSVPPVQLDWLGLRTVGLVCTAALGQHCLQLRLSNYKVSVIMVKKFNLIFIG